MDSELADAFVNVVRWTLSSNEAPGYFYIQHIIDRCAVSDNVRLELIKRAFDGANFPSVNPKAVGYLGRLVPVGGDIGYKNVHNVAVNQNTPRRLEESTAFIKHLMPGNAAHFRRMLAEQTARANYRAIAMVYMERAWENGEWDPESDAFIEEMVA